MLNSNMQKLNKNTKGFAVVELLLIVLTLVVIGVAGYFVAKHVDTKKKVAPASQSTATSTSTTSKSSTPKTVADPTLKWTPYSNKAGMFSFRYPATWVQASSPELCGDGLVLLGPNVSSVGKCGSESFGEVYIASVAGDQRAQDDLDTTLYKSISQVKVTVSGVAGIRETGVAEGQQSSPGVGTLPDGTKVVTYIFYTNSRTYTLNYYQSPTYPDVMSDFDLLVTNTFKFSS